MATIKEITTMCKAGQIQEAYELAKTDLEQFPTALWVHREMAWALNYQMKNDADIGNYQSMITHIDELKALNLLSIPADNILFDNVLFKIAGLIYHHVAPTDVNTPAKLSTISRSLKTTPLALLRRIHSFYKVLSSVEVGQKQLISLIGGILAT